MFFSNVTSFTSSNLEVKLYFGEPLVVSIGFEPDQIEIKLLKSYFLWPKPQSRLLRQQEERSSSEYFTIKGDLPLLMADEASYLSLKDMSESVTNVIQGQLLSSVALQVVFSGALSMLWNIFNTLQILMALPLLMITFPGNVTTIIDTLESIVNFEILPKAWLYDEIAVPAFGFESAEERLIRVEYEATKASETETEGVRSTGIREKFKGENILMNLLLAVVVFTLISMLILLVIMCRKLLVRCPQTVQSVLSRIERKLYLNAIIRACLEMYLAQCINFFVQAN